LIEKTSLTHVKGELTIYGSRFRLYLCVGGCAWVSV